MKALAIVAFALLVLAHPAAATGVLAGEAVVCTALGWLIWRAARPLHLCRPGMAW